MKVLLFGSLAEAAGTHSIDVQGAVNTTQLREAVLEKLPALRNHVFKLSVNRIIEAEDAALVETDEIALLPPYSGG